MKQNLKSIFLVAISIALFSSCEGPQGPTGNANVKIWKTLVTSEWKDNGNGVVYKFDCPIIAPAVVMGSYHVAASVKTGGSWLATPFIDAGSGFTQTCQFAYGINTPNSYLTAYSDNNITTIQYFISEIKVAVIEGMPGKKQWTVEEIEANPDLFNITYIEN